MKDYNYLLRQRFGRYILKKWKGNNRYQDNINCVYALITINIFNRDYDIVYIGSTKCLRSRWKSHKIPYKVTDPDLICCLVHKPMDNGKNEYEKKLIKKLKPLFNKQYKN